MDQIKTFSQVRLQNGGFQAKMFEGWLRRYKHYSPSCKCEIYFQVYTPKSKKKLPILYFLNGLTRNDAYVMDLSGIQRFAAKHEIAVVSPDTSPRDIEIEGIAEHPGYGLGASFYINATNPRWVNWQFEDYIIKDLPQVIKENLPDLDTSVASISGISMGGHGAISLSLKYPDLYRSTSAFCPPFTVAHNIMGQFTFRQYLGDDATEWQKHDCQELIQKYKGKTKEILIDVGSLDELSSSDPNINPLKLNQPLVDPVPFREAAEKNSNIKLNLRIQDEYNHSSYFLQTFIEEHVDYHAKYLKNEV